MSHPPHLGRQACLHLSRPGFSLVELLVAISIIVILLAIVLPTLARWRFSVGVTQCAVNFQKRGEAELSYAAENQGRLFRDPIPGGVGHNSWDVSNQFLPRLAAQGVNQPRQWFCPVQYEDYEGKVMLGAGLSTMAQVDAYHKAGYGYFSIISFSYWIPRRDSGTTFPLISNQINHPDGWPVSTHDARANNQPIMTDLCSTSGAQGINLDVANGAHKSGGRIRGTTLLFADGHVEVRDRSEMKYRFSGNWHQYY